MELALRTVFTAVQILGILMPPLLLFVLLGRKPSRRRMAVLLSVILLAAELVLISALTLCPPIFNASEPKLALTDADKDAIRYVSAGIYSRNIPLFPVCVIVTKNTEDVLYFRTHYAFWGTTEHVFVKEKSMYECQKPLAGW